MRDTFIEWGLVAMTVLFILGVVVGFNLGSGPMPSCPQEDSCYADYQNGHWTIIEGDRP